MYIFDNTKKEEILWMLKEVSLEELQRKAQQITLSNFGNKVWIRTVIEFSNYCQNDCLYCGIRRSNKKIKRYNLEDNQIIDLAKKAISIGVKTIVLQSGESRIFSNVDRLCRVIEKIRKLKEDIAITISCGYFTKNELKTLRKLADRYLLRFEISDEKIYGHIKNGEKLSKRIDMLINLKEIGFEVGSGFMIGLPGETDDILAENILLCKQLNLDMVGIGPFIPNPDTPLGNEKIQDFNRTLRAVSILRILMPLSNIPATTAMGTVDPLGREKAILCGANVIMPIITPTEVKKYYLLYPKKICIYEDGFSCIGCLSKRLSKIDRILSFEKGDSLNKCLQLQKV